MKEIYLHMIRQAQEFMNENHYADISRVHCLLRKMMPKEYHDLIDQIKECQDPHVIFNIHGGNNLIAPNASRVEQKVVEKYVLSVNPEFHTKLFPDSILEAEQKNDLIQDVSEANSIYKIYICWMRGVRELKKGDELVIYRTSDYKGPASYRSACTSVCTVCEVKTIKDFANEDDFVKYTNRYSVFSEKELRGWYRTKNYFTVVKMVYNIAFTKKVINKVMKEQVGLNPNYWGFFRLTDAQFDKLLELGEINERYIVD